MADPRFFKAAGPFSLRRLAEIADARLDHCDDPERLIDDVAPLEAAGPDEISFLDNRRYAVAFSESRAGACLVAPELADRAPAGMALLLTAMPYHGYARIAKAFHPSAVRAAEISDRAIVAENAVLGTGVSVAGGAVIGAGAELGAGCQIAANATIGDGVVLGENCIIGAGVSLTHAILGARVIVHGGARLGQDGFGFAMGPAGHEKVPQLGRVVIGDDVEIGANTTIDRGAGPDTVVGSGTKIDNLVQIAHNVNIGSNCVIVAQVGIAGSTRIGDFVVIGGQAGLTGHLTIGDGARIGAQSGVMRDVPAGATVVGSPAIAQRQHWRQMTALATLARRGGKGDA